MARTPEHPTEDERRAGRVEALIGLASAAAVLGILGVLVVHAMRPGDALPDFVIVETDAPDVAPGQLRFEVLNRGERPAASVTVALSLRDGDTVVHRRTVLVDFLPSRSRATGAFVLSARDRGLAPELTVESYLDP